MGYFTDLNETMFLSAMLPIAEKENLDKFLEILEDSNVSQIIIDSLNYGEKRGRTGYDPFNLFATIIYSFTKNTGSLRKIEENIMFDTRFMYLMQEKKPTYATISKFINNVIVGNAKEIFSRIVNSILNKYDIDTSDAFIDGTKLEANANKYKFVWKPTKFHTNLNIKINDLIRKYFSLPDYKTTYISKEVANYLNNMNEKMIKEGIDPKTIRRGSGIRNPQIVKDYFLLYDYLIKLLDYEEQESICGENRNSYFKTDKDATAMCLKEDYYSGLGSNMHAGYNVQIMVSKGIILDYLVLQDRNDMKSLVPMLDDYYLYYGKYPVNVCADSGYATTEGYRYLNEKGIGNYIKYMYWQQDMEGKHFDPYEINEDGTLTCLDGETVEGCLKYERRYPRKKGNTLFVVKNCNYCRHKQECGLLLKYPIKDVRIFDVNTEMYRFKKEATKNLLSPKGIEMRINRSSQVEGAFGVIKQDMEYDRIRRRGMENVTAEIMLICLGYNIKKLITLIQGKAKTEYWKAPENLQPEQKPTPNLKKIIKQKAKKVGINAQIRNKYKYK